MKLLGWISQDELEEINIYESNQIVESDGKFPLEGDTDDSLGS